MPQLSVLPGPVIAARGTQSAVLDLGTLYIVGLVMPDDWTPAVVSMLISPDGDNFYDLFDAKGNEFVFNVTPGVVINVEPNRMMLARYLQLRSGTRKAPVAQTIVRNFRTIGTMQLAI